MAGLNAGARLGAAFLLGLVLGFALALAWVAVGDAEAGGMPPCRRAEWPHWADLDKDGRDTRQEVLARDARPSTAVWAGPEHVAAGLVRADDVGLRLIAGRWIDPYTGDVIEAPDALDVDHLVALCEAHRAGGWRWSREKRRAFANDPINLWAVSLGANRAKADKGPDRWVPDRPDIRCRWLERRALVRQLYALPTPATERAAVGVVARESCR